MTATALTPEHINNLRAIARSGPGGQWAADKLIENGESVYPQQDAAPAPKPTTAPIAVAPVLPTIKPPAPASESSPDGEAVKFLKEYYEAVFGYPTLTAIHTDPVTGAKGKIETQTFPAPTNWATVRKWIEARRGGANIYFLVNPTREEKDNKASKTDLAALVALHVDVDCRVGEAQEAGIARIVDTFHKYKIPPSIITKSGGGAQAFWLLDKPLMLDGTKEAADDAALYNVQIERDLAGDACHNVDRIMRLVGTKNIPNAVKIKKGRKPAEAHLVEFPGHRYPIETFTKAAPQQPQATPAPAPKGKAPPSIPAITSFDDHAFRSAAAEVMHLLRAGKLPDDASEKAKALTAGGIWLKVVSELRRIGLTNTQIKQAAKLSPLSADSASWPRGFDGDMDRVIDKAEAYDDDIMRLNEKHAVLPIGGKTRVVKFGEDAEFPGRTTIVMAQTLPDFEALQNKYRHEWTDDDGEKHSIPVGTFWRHSRYRRQYDGGQKFMPHDDKVIPDTLNLWHGFGVQPIKPDGKSGAAGCRRFLDFAYDVICSGNAEHYDYWEKREAFIVQKRERSEVAIALRTEDEGTGKGFHERHLGHLLGNHWLQVGNPAHIIGKHNPHLETLLRLTADEALFVGNHEHRNSLFGLITEEHITVEPKFCGVYRVPNFLNIGILSNRDHFIPVSGTARRFFVPTVSTAHMQDFDYFRAIEDQLRNDGGYEALLYHLLHEVDLTDFNVCKVPRTAGLLEQADYSRHGVDGLVELVCNTGRVPCEHYKWPGFTITSGYEQGAGFAHYCAKHPDKQLASLGAVTVIRRLGKEWGCITGQQKREQGTKDRTQGFQWPELVDLRKRFEEKVGPQEWQYPQQTEWTASGSEPDPLQGRM